LEAWQMVKWTLPVPLGTFDTLAITLFSQYQRFPMDCISIKVRRQQIQSPPKSLSSMQCCLFRNELLTFALLLLSSMRLPIIWRDDRDDPDICGRDSITVLISCLQNNTLTISFKIESSEIPIPQGFQSTPLMSSLCCSNIVSSPIPATRCLSFGEAVQSTAGTP
jgi:hypothetical protein